jgi:hypothetical protein
MTEKRERIVVRTAQGYDVLEGRRLNDEPLDRAAADRLAQRGVRVPHSYVRNEGETVSAAPSTGAKAPPPSKRKPPAPPEPPLSREEAMDRAAAKANAEMDAANARPIPAAAFEVDPWLGVGGSAGFSVNGNLWSGKKPR